jgi:hypothetical protein
MLTASCKSLHESILKHLTDHTAVEQVRDLCVVTLPIRTVDNRLVDVFIEERATDYYFVHDAGKAANELILQGVNITPSIGRDCERIAASFGIQWADESFQTKCKIDKLNASIFGVGMSSSVATSHLLGHVADTEEEAVREQFGVVLKSWAKRRARIKESVQAPGKWRQHSFDFVAYPKTAQPIAISVLAPSGNPLSSAVRAAFRSKDLEGTPAASWRKVIVETRPELWTGPARDLLGKCSDVVIELNAGDAPTPQKLNEYLGGLLNAA